MEKLNIAVIGLGAFGHQFLPIYLDHPNVDTVTVFDTNPSFVESMRERYPDIRVADSFESILQDTSIDAVHLLTPIPLHAQQTIAVLESGKHCACAVPMATSLEDLQAIVDAARKNGKNYMMMETTLYTYQFFYVKEMLNSGALGKIQFLRGSHYQDMIYAPDYWMGLPPMWYGTHAIGPMVALSGSRIRKVHCFGSGTMDKSLHTRYGNPYPVETAIFAFENGLKGEATRSLFETVRAYQEGLFVYGSKSSFEWGILDLSDPYVTVLEERADGSHRYSAKVENVSMPNYYHSLPETIRKYTVNVDNFDPMNPELSLKKGAGGGHHGSHPHLVHEFVMSIIEKRRPAIDENLSANITAAGICAHMSAMNDGDGVVVPEF